MGGRILQQCSTSPSFCHPFGVFDALVPQRRGYTPACGLPPLWGLGCSRSSTQGLYPSLWSTTPSGFWILSFLNAGVVPLPVFCHPFGVLDALVPQRRGCTPACGLPPLRGLGCSRSSTQGLYPLPVVCHPFGVYLDQPYCMNNYKTCDG